jgi:hypothetical protein
MKRDRLVFLLSLVLAALLGLGVGWWLRDRSDDSLEHRARTAVHHVQDAFRTLTR